MRSIGKKAAIAAASVLAAVFMTFFCAELYQVRAAEISETDVEEPGEGNVFLGLSGRFYADDKEALDRINEIRYEACTEGDVPDPRDASRMLTESDYVPIRWSSDLEKIARVRAYESSLTVAHARLNGKDIWSVKSNGYQSWGENLAWNWNNTMVSGIEQWYGEKTDWVNQNSSAVTGHYESLIDPDNTYVGLGDFYSTLVRYRNTVSGEFSSYYSNMDEAMLAPGTDEVLQKVEVQTSYITGYACREDCTVEVGGTVSAELAATAQISSGTYTMPVLGGVEYTSSDTDVATVDADGMVTAAAYGKAFISANIGGTEVASFNVTVPDEDAAAVTGVELDRTSASIAVGSALTLTATVSPEDAADMSVTWSSSNPGVASVDSSGLVTGISIGSAVITVTTNDGGFTAACDITVIGQTEDYKYDIKDGKVSILEYIGSGTEVEIPSKIDGCPVTEIWNNAFYRKNTVTRVVIPDGVTRIGNAAFQYCTGLTEVIIPDSVAEISAMAFQYCTVLKEAVLPEGLTKIDGYTFYCCWALERITIPASVTMVQGQAFYSCDSLKDVYYGGTKEEWDRIDILFANEPLLNAEIHYRQNDISDAAVTLSGTEKTKAGLYWVLYDGADKTPGVTVKLSDSVLTAGTDYTVSYTANRNVGTAAVTVTGNGNYTGSASASFLICFRDVPETHSFQKAVYWAVGEGIAAGYSGDKTGTFGVGDNITRGQVVMFLWRAAGQPKAKDLTSQSFSDVSKKSAFYKAIQWAVEEGIVGGYKDGTFRPGENCTRGQIAMFLWRYDGRKAPAGSTQTFSDVPTSSNFYKAVQWAAEQDITAGYKDGTFGVNKSCTRGHCVTFLYRLPDGK